MSKNFSTTIEPIDFGLDFVPKIFCTNRQIFFETIEHLEELPGDMLNFQSVDEGSSKVLGKCIADKQLCLKEGTPVMLLYNLDNKLVNGSRGTVQSFKNGNPIVYFPKADRKQEITPRSWTVYHAFDPNKVTAKRTQIPLTLNRPGLLESSTAGGGADSAPPV